MWQLRSGNSPRRLIEILGLATVYFVYGRLGLLLAIPPGYATAIWPPAGFALAGLLLLGERAWPGILLGSFAVNVGNGFEAGSAAAILRSTVVPATIAGGACFQALLGARLVCRFVDRPTSLGREKDVLKILAIGGPFACLVNATVSVASLALHGRIGESEIPFSWWTWWVGDTIGVLIFGPLVLLWAEQPDESGLRRKIFVSVPLACTFALILVLFVRTSASEQKRVDLDFERRGDELVHTLARDIQVQSEVLDFVGGLLSNSPPIGRQEICVFTRRVLEQHPRIESIAWCPAPSQDPAGECARLEYLNPPCTPDGREDGAPPTLDESARSALDLARDSGLLIAGLGAQVGRETSCAASIPFFLPVYCGNESPPTDAERRARLKGFAVGRFCVADMLADAISGGAWDECAVQLVDVTDAARPLCLFAEPPDVDEAGVVARKGGPAARAWRTSRLAVGERRWELRLDPSPKYLAAHRSWQAWSLLAGGLLFTGILGAFLLIVTGRTMRVEKIVLERTDELRRTNQVLKRETARRITAQRIANIDPLTELLNRRGFEAELTRETRRARRSGSPLSAVLLDCDDFKRINETLGHAVGDIVLQQIAHRLRDTLRPTDHLARIGGDEFLVLLPDTRTAEAVQAAERLRLAVSDNPLRLSDGPVRLTASLGIERVPLDVVSIEEVLARTHLSLQHSKRTGKNRVSSRGARAAASGPSMSHVADELRTRSSFRAVKQQILNLSDEVVVGWEFLARGPHGSFEMPGDFFRVALERNILTLVDLHCLRACIEASHSTPGELAIHLNLFPSTILGTPEERLVELFPPAGGGRRYVVEVSEQQFIGDPSCLRSPVLALKRAGVQVAIDDVGFGRSSLETLILLEPDIVKVDQRIVKGAARDRSKEQMLRRLVTVVGAMGGSLVAEGIENRADLDLLRDIGVPRGQGFLWGKPA